ncbi:hypothetical protein EV643_113208 [Kribbella sp. VKM Ac-2527]|uniref:SWIM-type domain-containing protein n=1 Tax=Kribbella caucasensis TaxID=2512215 RepID=A0A4V3C9G4_9ACTN|nr:SWIM zinc finger family protein [Kribbella sp. VKM Ac-2527]TDO45435.1 hypothetical protein EV643_113208 [Kribbella sp. VKM Ac-2527]
MSEARGFPAFGVQRGRSTRGKSWWARAWVQAMEDTSLDSDQLRKGRRYANSGQVGTITISPGRIAATVHAPQDSYDAVVLVDRLSDDEWRRFLDQVGARAGHIAALLDGEMPHDLVDAAGDAGVPLLPGIGDLDPSCTCDSWELPCQHAAGLCYQVAWLLDEDPFVLLLMRGRSREDLLDELQQRMSAGPRAAAISPADEGSGPDGPSRVGHGGPGAGGGALRRGSIGVLAGEAFASAVGPLPEPPAMPTKVGLDDLVVSGTQALAELVLLPLLVLDAARRARGQLSALLSGGAEPWVLDEWQDAVRLAADYPELGEALRRATGRPAELAIGVQAWSYGGAPGLDVLENSWSPEAGELARARVEVQAAADDPIELTAEGNRLTAGGRQLRLDRVGRWHPYRLDSDQWMPAGPPDRDPAAAFAVQDEW